MIRNIIILASVLSLLNACNDKPDRPRINSNKTGGGGIGNGNGEVDNSDGKNGEPEKSPSGFALIKQGSIHRLNNREYNNTVRDLLGTSLRPADAFPEDPLASNFDNEAGPLSISPALGKYLYTAATTLADEAAAKDVTVLTKCKAITETTCLQAFISSFGLRAWRRPLIDSEKKTIFDISQQAAVGAAKPLNDFVKQTVLQFLVSPYFTFRIELDDKPDSKETRKLTGYELASRLSYFLWSSMPSDALLAAAADESILTDEFLSKTVKSMLADPKAKSLNEGFGDVWLDMKAARKVTLDAKLFPKYNNKIRDSMVLETQMFFNEFLTKDLDVNTMLTANFTFANDDLAAYYGLPLPKNATPVKVELPAGPRRGLLSHGSILTSTSPEARTSIVRRGVFVLKKILCTEPPDFPVGTVDALPTVLDPKKTTREILADHIAKPTCAGCHLIIDPPGFALEGFGPDAMPRTLDRGNPIDSSGSIRGSAFKDSSEFSEVIQKNGSFQTCVAQKVLSYAMGRAVTEDDEPLIESLVKNSKTSGASLRALIESTVLSEVFRSR